MKAGFLDSDANDAIVERFDLNLKSRLN